MKRSCNCLTCGLWLVGRINLGVLCAYLPLGLVLVKLHLGADESVVVAAVVLQLLLAQVDDLRAHAVHKVLKRSEVVGHTRLKGPYTLNCEITSVT